MEKRHEKHISDSLSDYSDQGDYWMSNDLLNELYQVLISGRKATWSGGYFVVQTSPAVFLAVKPCRHRICVEYIQ